MSAEPVVPPTCSICGAERVRCEAGELCVNGCDDAFLDAIEAFYDACRPDGAPADADSKLRTAIAAFWKSRAAVPALPAPEPLRGPWRAEREGGFWFVLVGKSGLDAVQIDMLNREMTRGEAVAICDALNRDAARPQ